MPKATNTKAVTTAVTFCNTIAAGKIPLLQVAAGIPAEDALYQAGAYLESARGILATMEDDCAVAFGVAYLVELAESIVDAVAGGLAKEGGAQ